MWLAANLNCFLNLLNFKGNSDIERYQTANKKIPFKYTRPVEDWLHEKGNTFPDVQCSFSFFLPFCLILFESLFLSCRSLQPLEKSFEALQN